MPTNASKFFYDCKGCGAILRPHAGYCCLFCSYGDAPPCRSKRHGERTGRLSRLS